MPLVAAAAADTGVHLVAVSRPGYGASSTSPPGLVSVARDTLELVDFLGLERFGVHGISGGGPFALALTAVAPDRVGRVVVSAGPGSPLTLGELSPTESAVLALAQAGDSEGAWRLMHAEAVESYGDAAGISPTEFQTRHFPTGPPPGGYFDGKPELFRIFVADMHRSLQRLDGCVRDNLSWCGSWDVDLSAVTPPVLLAYGLDDQMVPASHGEWLHSTLPNSQLQVRAGGHGDVTFGIAADAYRFLLRESS